MSRIPAPADLVALSNRLTRIERRLDTLAGQRRLGSASIHGALRVLEGDVTVDGGQLLQRVGADLIPLAALAGGADAESAGNSITYNSNTGGFVSVSGGPSISGVEVHTGRLLVLMGCHVLVQDVARLYFSYQLSGAQSVGPAQSRSAFVRGRSSTSTERNPFFGHMHKGLTPGTYSINARAQAASVQEIPGIDDVELGARILIAIPY